MNTPISFVDAITVRLISFGVRSAVFFIWEGLGIQESMYALLSVVVGISPSALIIISLATRVQEIITAIPGAALWFRSEGYRIIETTRSKEGKQQNSSGTGK